jgi:sugar phosphate isomerase/epimerase
MAKMKIALQVYTIREHLQDVAGFASSMAQVADIGYRFVELAGVGDDVPLEDQKRVCDDCGLTVISSHTPYGQFQDGLESVIAKHQLLGAKFAGLGGLPGSARTAEGYAQAATEMEQWAVNLAEHGITLFYHNHHLEFEKLGGRLVMDILFGDTSPRVTSELDTYWVQYGGASPAAWIKKLAGRVPLLHCKDFEMLEGTATFAEVGRGNLDWPAIFEAAETAGTQYLIVEEDRCTRPCMESIEISYKNLRSMGFE